MGRSQALGPQPVVTCDVTHRRLGPPRRKITALVSKAPALLSLFVLATLAFGPGCTNTNCIPIPDGVYVAITPDGGPIFTDAGSTSIDAGDGSAGSGEVTYTFQNGLPVNAFPPPFSQWSCDSPTSTCEMTYVCTNGSSTLGVVTSFSPGMLAFSVTPPGTIVQLQPP